MSTIAKPLSPYLKAIARQGVFDQDTLEQANALPTAGMQEQALNSYREEKTRLMSRIVRGMLLRNWIGRAWRYGRKLTFMQMLTAAMVVGFIWGLLQH